MKKKYFISLTLFFLILFFSDFRGVSYAQNRYIDSLLILIKNDKTDTNKVYHLNILSKEYINAGSYDSALLNAKVALQISTVIADQDVTSDLKQSIQKGIAVTYSNIGLVHWRQSEFPQALDYYLKALKIYEELGFKNKIAGMQGNIGGIYLSQGNHTKALGYYFKVLKAFEELGDKNKMATAYGGIGNIYGEQKQPIKALDYYFKALKIYEELGDENGMATWFLNIGVAYYHLKDYQKALDYYFKALKINEKLEDKNGMAYIFANFGLIYHDLAVLNQNSNKKESDLLFSKALDYYFKSLKINEEFGNKNLIAVTLGNIGSLYTNQNRSKEAEKYLLQSLKIDTAIVFLLHTEETHELLSQLYSKMGNYQKALEHYQNAMFAKDSIFNQEKNKDITRKEMNYEFEKKETALKAEKEKQDLLTAAEHKRQQLFLWFILAVAFAVAIIAIIIFRSLQITKKQKHVIEIQNKEITKQKQLVEEKNKDNADSVSYARRIQSSFLTSETYIKRYLKEYFILYKPRDVVSGDFYWIHQQGDYLYFCVADCTGHGIPGAFMSLIGMGILNEIINSKQIKETNAILDELRRIVILALNPEGAIEEGKDGMDLIFGRLNLQTKELQYSAANNSFYVSRNGELIKHKLDKMPVGKYWEFEKPFQQQTIQLETGDIIYASTDGFQDQFGGAKEQKIMSKGLEKLISRISQQNLNEQKNILEKEFMEWKGNLEQVDDVTILGIRI
ncbi:MAG: tetratricopeptide repeat protein [Bacteroidetes bacterium]|nr:tetratricopeptide repeat protein [Bacteroidota bacterium]